MRNAPANAPSRRVFLGALAPPPSWRLPVAIALGVFCGLGLLTLHASRATSYVSDRPEVCINCHIMNPEYAAWQRGSHPHAATCSDCHVPHDTLVRKYGGKAIMGLRHAWVFTWNAQPQAIRASTMSIDVIQQNCVRCHGAQMNSSFVIEQPADASWHEAGTVCWRCHRDVGHGRVSSLASGRTTLAPRRPARVPRWLAERIAQASGQNDEAGVRR